MKRLLPIIVIVGVIFIYLQNRRQTPSSTSVFQTPINSNVTATVEFEKEKSTQDQLVFKIVLDTHSVDLNAFDLENNINLKKNGQKIKPQQVNTSGSIHHQTAEVVFKSTTLPFTIVITNLDNLPERKFEFSQL